MLVFSNAIGTVSVIKSDRAVSPFPVSIANTSIDTVKSSSVGLIISQFERTQVENFQLQHSLANTVNVTAFGSRASPIAISGMCFIKTCEDRDINGLAFIENTYNSNCVSQNNSLLLVNLPTGTHKAILVGMRVGMNNAATNIGQWSYDLITFGGAKSK